ncbi:type 1 fimbrial protein [Neisseriaceae bacterium TC5R-5]|nr:type 1 fimbrial protein [Neisseriaceae bacterium TC5R-5]
MIRILKQFSLKSLDKLAYGFLLLSIFSPAYSAPVYNGAATTTADNIDITINFRARYLESTCKLSVNGSGPDATVVLPTLGTDSFPRVNSVAGSTVFSINVTECSSLLNQVAISFASLNADASNYNLINTLDTGSNVQLQLLDLNGTLLRQQQVGLTNNAGQASHYVDLSGVRNKQALLKFAVQYYANEYPVVPGNVSSSADIAIEYR